MEQSEKPDKKIKISVRSLVEFVLRSGDLDNRKVAGADKEAMQAGSRIHRKIQKRMGADYQAEVTLKHVVDEGPYQIAIEGRADGIQTRPSGVLIDEIKGVYMNLAYLNEPVPVHMAQAMCYGYIYSLQKNLNTITLQMTYCNIETEEIKRFQEEKTFEELELWFQGLIHEYVKWAEYLYTNELRRNESIHDLEFPYPYREGQRDLAVSVYRAISRNRNLFIQAPTGIGKTLSTVFPALKAIGEGYGEKLFYLTAKTVTRGVAEETYAILRKHGLYMRIVTITAKEKLCFLEKPDCNPEACPYAKGHFDRVNEAVFDIIHEQFGITRDIILEYAEKYQVCPFEFCLDISSWVDGIICDYNYVFDPDVRLKRYFSDGSGGEYLFLVDEAHNLVSRAREMYSASLEKEDFLLIKKIMKERDQRIVKGLERCNKALLEMKRECEGYKLQPGIHHFVTELMILQEHLDQYMEEHLEFQDRDLVLDFFFKVRNFLNIFERVDDHYQVYTELLPDGHFQLRLLCIDPSRNLQECLAMGNSTTFFSATLLPVNYYKELLSGNLEDYAVYAHSPFDVGKRLLVVAGDVSSKYTRRNRREYEKIADYIRQIMDAKKGNYIAFFPSYQYMQKVLEVLEEVQKVKRIHVSEQEAAEGQSWESEQGEQQNQEDRSGFQILVQSQHMTDSQRETFLEEFSEDRETSLLGLCVMGGVFSEGIDLKENRLIGAIIVGTGLPMVCTEQTILKDYFDNQGKRGFDYAYQYPGMNKVMQAAGRVIRTVQDTGVIALLDERFLNSDYQALFPVEWQDYQMVKLHNIGEVVRQFWNDSFVL